MHSIDDRMEIINEIINVGTHNPNLDTYYLAALFAELSAEIMVFERIGVDLIQPKLQAMIAQNHPLKAVILSYIDAPNNTITVQQSIEGYLNV